MLIRHFDPVVDYLSFVCVCQTVEEASAQAAAATFGQKHTSTGKRAVRSAVVDAHLHEAAYAEGYSDVTSFIFIIIIIITFK